MTIKKTDNDQKVAEIQKSVEEFSTAREQYFIIKAPPGSGKTRILSYSANYCFQNKMRVAVATQTNAQADELCERLLSDHGNIPVVRFVSKGSTPAALPPGIQIINDKADLPKGRCLIVGTSAKWAFLSDDHQFDIMFVEESWQLAWADFLLLTRLAPKFALIGDPGQIPPVVTIQPHRWETALTPPHMSAPQVLLRVEAAIQQMQMPATWRLPIDTAKVVGEFYDFEFSAIAKKDDRTFTPKKLPQNSKTLTVLEHLQGGSIAGLKVATPLDGPPLEKDLAVTEVVLDCLSTLLGSEASLKIDTESIAKISPQHIGIVATHRVMVSTIELALPPALQGNIRVDTPERWQGLERPLMIFVHPLSSCVSPSSFDLETGRLCVMASRHKVGMVVISRDHIGETLDSHFPTADHPFYGSDVTGRGHYLHSKFWNHLEAENLFDLVS